MTLRAKNHHWVLKMWSLGLYFSLLYFLVQYRKQAALSWHLSLKVRVPCVSCDPCPQAPRQVANDEDPPPLPQPRKKGPKEPRAWRRASVQRCSHLGPGTPGSGSEPAFCVMGHLVVVKICSTNSYKYIDGYIYIFFFFHHEPDICHSWPQAFWQVSKLTANFCQCSSNSRRRREQRIQTNGCAFLLFLSLPG